MIKILCIGNSFSQDTTAFVERLSNNQLFVRNLYIGGCDLKTHCDNALKLSPVYEYQKDGEAIMKISLQEALRKEKWDFVTVQQVSQDAGRKETYEPFMKNLLWFVRNYSGGAKTVLLRAWPYEDGSTHGGFVFYKGSPEIMFKQTLMTTEEVAKTYGLNVIKVGDFIYKLINNGFNKENGISLYRDTFHLSFGLGRYSAALAFCKFFGVGVDDIKYLPNGVSSETADKIKSLLR